MMRWSLWLRKQREADLEDEIRHDLALEAEERIQSGTPREEAERLREREALRLSLQSVVQRLQRSQDPRHRAMLEEALADLQRKLESLGACDGTATPSDH